MKVFAAAALLALTAVSVASAEDVKMGKKEGVGAYLTDSKGMTLYIFKKDSPDKSACAGDCVTRWPLFAAEKVTAPEGVKASDFGTITRDDGKKQTTYKGAPLYYFFKDKAAGDTNGQGVGNVWFVVDPAR